MRGREYSYRTISPRQAVKTYTCPGCGNVIAAGVAHIVAWQADSIWGDSAAIADRRHWHTHCWSLA
ncbi:hypothetical protein EII31_00745 [Leucobacter sp. OH2974_COT-288]|nr:hypothetical protein EII31_00745 [Leucobacter sp. OH2974_COT-288]